MKLETDLISPFKLETFKAKRIDIYTKTKKVGRLPPQLKL